MADIETAHHVHGEECFPRVLWANCILWYLYKLRSQTGIVSSNSDEAQLSFYDDGDEDLEIQSTAATVLADSDEEVRMKFLDCLAELLSPVEGGDSVTATALRENEDYVEVHVARN